MRNEDDRIVFLHWHPFIFRGVKTRLSRSKQVPVLDCEYSLAGGLTPHTQHKGAQEHHPGAGEGRQSRGKGRRYRVERHMI
jgi:hypothetical protein